MNAEQPRLEQERPGESAVSIRLCHGPKALDGLAFHQSVKAYPQYKPIVSGMGTLRRAAEDPERLLVIAVSGRWIVGFALLEPPAREERWSRLGPDRIREVSVIEVARAFRGRGLSRHILHTLLQYPEKEDHILYMIGYSWTWDLDGEGIAPMAYRNRLIRLFEREGFETAQTNEPNVMMRPENLFMVRVGAAVPREEQQRFKLLRFGLDPDR